MIRLRKICYLLALAFVPAGCSPSDAPIAPKAETVKGSGPPAEPPKVEKKGGRVVHPGGANLPGTP